jgi:hypothetical protein
MDYISILAASLKERITGKMIPVLRSVEHLLQAAWRKETLPQEDLDSVHKHFGEDLDPQRLANQLQSLENLASESENYER